MKSKSGTELPRDLLESYRRRSRKTDSGASHAKGSVLVAEIGIPPASGYGDEIKSTGLTVSLNNEKQHSKSSHIHPSRIEKLLFPMIEGTNSNPSKINDQPWR